MVEGLKIVRQVINISQHDYFALSIVYLLGIYKKMNRESVAMNGQAREYTYVWTYIFRGSITGNGTRGAE